MSLAHHNSNALFSEALSAVGVFTAPHNHALPWHCASLTPGGGERERESVKCRSSDIQTVVTTAN